MSDYKVINAGSDLLGKWYVKLYTFPKGTTPDDHATLMSNLRNRSFLPVTNTAPKVNTIIRQHECNAVRQGCPIESTILMIHKLAVCKCDNTQQWFLIGEVNGHTALGRNILDPNMFYSFGFVGWKTHEEVINISYLTIDIDFSDSHQPLALSHYEEITTWCERTSKVF